MEKTILELVKGLAKNEDAVQVEEKVEKYSTTFLITVADEDVGRIIGAGGKNISALTTIAKAVASKMNVINKVLIKINNRK